MDRQRLRKKKHLIEAAPLDRLDQMLRMTVYGRGGPGGGSPPAKPVKGGVWRGFAPPAKNRGVWGAAPPSQNRKIFEKMPKYMFTHLYAYLKYKPQQIKNDLPKLQFQTLVIL